MSKRPSILTSQSGSSPLPKQCHGIKLTPEFLAMKTKQSLPQIRKLNLWGQDLRDVSVLKNAQNIEVLALTVNQIDSLKDFQGLRHLRELYLRRNQIPTDLQELRYLSTLRNLRVLNLSENPISAEQGGLPCYRKVVLKHVPWLEKLDDVPVNYADVTSAQQLDLDQVCQMMNQCAIAEEIESTDSQPPGKEDKMPANFTKDVPRTSPKPITSSVRKSVVPRIAVKASEADQIFRPKGRELRRTPPNEQNDASGGSRESNDADDQKGQMSGAQDLDKREDGVQWLVGRQNNGHQRSPTAWCQPEEHASPLVQPSSIQQKPLKTQRKHHKGHTNSLQMNDTIVPPPLTPRARPDQGAIKASAARPSPLRQEPRASKKVVQKQVVKQRKKNENILCAIIALMKELDKSGLEFVKLDANKRIAKLDAEGSGQMANPPRSGRTPDHGEALSKKRGMWNRGGQHDFDPEDVSDGASGQSLGSAEEEDSDVADMALQEREDEGQNLRRRPRR